MGSFFSKKKNNQFKNITEEMPITKEMPTAILLNDNLYEKNLYPTDIGDENFTWRVEYAYNSKREQESSFKLNSQWNLYYKTVNDKKKFIFDQYLHYYKKKK